MQKLTANPNIPTFSLKALTDLYRNTVDSHKTIYDLLYEQVSSDSLLVFHKRYGDHMIYGYAPFNYLLKMIFLEMKPESKYLEIGVYKGQTLSLMLMLSSLYEKPIEVHGVSTFDGLGDKYSNYAKTNYMDIVLDTCSVFSKTTPKLYKGNSTSGDIVNTVHRSVPYQCVFIDGGHDYDTALKDLENYAWMIDNNGYLLVDDSCCDQNIGPEIDFKGHQEVTDALNKYMDGREDFIFMFPLVMLRCLGGTGAPGNRNQ